jgi:hypothetical protein
MVTKSSGFLPKIEGKSACGRGCAEVGESVSCCLEYFVPRSRYFCWNHLPRFIPPLEISSQFHSVFVSPVVAPRESPLRNATLIASSTPFRKVKSRLVSSTRLFTSGLSAALLFLVVDLLLQHSIQPFVSNNLSYNLSQTTAMLVSPTSRATHFCVRYRRSSLENKAHISCSKSLAASDESL